MPREVGGDSVIRAARTLRRPSALAREPDVRTLGRMAGARSEILPPGGGRIRHAVLFRAKPARSGAIPTVPLRRTGAHGALSAVPPRRPRINRLANLLLRHPRKLRAGTLNRNGSPSSGGVSSPGADSLCGSARQLSGSVREAAVTMLRTVRGWRTFHVLQGAALTAEGTPGALVRAAVAGAFPGAATRPEAAPGALAAGRIPFFRLLPSSLSGQGLPRRAGSFSFPSRLPFF